jgi:hypothetical protein
LRTALHRQAGQVTAQLSQAKITHVIEFLENPNASNYNVLVAAMASAHALTAELVCSYNENDALPYDLCEALSEHHVAGGPNALRQQTALSAAQNPCLDMTIRPALRQGARFVPDTILRSDARLAPIVSAQAEWATHERSRGRIMEGERPAAVAATAMPPRPASVVSR